MHVEDIVGLLSQLVLKNEVKGEWHRNFISNVQLYVFSGNAISTNQSFTILKIAAQYKHQLAAEAKINPSIMAGFISNPSYKQPPYASKSVKREVRYVGGDKLAFRFKADQTVLDELKATRTSQDLDHQRPKWNNRFKVWIITVTSSNLDSIMDVIRNHNFDYDSDVLEYVTLCNNSKKSKPTFFLYGDENVVYGNIPSDAKLQYIVTNILGGELI